MNELRLLAGALALSLSLAAGAAPAIISVTGGSIATSGSDQLYGWKFRVANPVSVSALGAYDYARDGMEVAHDIGIFRVSDQSLVASVTLASGVSGFLDGDYRYQSLGSTVGLAADDYEIVMTMPSGNGDYQLISATAVTTATDISWLDSAFASGSALAYVGNFGSFAVGMFGPNFQIGGTEVPEPSLLSLLVGGLFGLAFVRRSNVS